LLTIVVKRYAGGKLQVSTPLVIAEADAIEAGFFDWYSDPEHQRAYRFLSLVMDGIEIDGRLWLLWGTWEGVDGLVTVHDHSGAIVRRIRFPALQEGEAHVAPRRFAVDPSVGRVYLVAPSASSLWAFDLPEGVEW
jgi:hypothetical protein